MRKTGKILSSLLLILMLVMTMNVFATEDVVIDEEIIETDELEEFEEEVELLSDEAVCYIGDSAETGMTFTSLKEAILAKNKVPFYGTVQSHMISKSVAIKAGFMPAWSELYTMKLK